MRVSLRSRHTTQTEQHVQCHLLYGNAFKNSSCYVLFTSVSWKYLGFASGNGVSPHWCDGKMWAPDLCLMGFESTWLEVWIWTGNEWGSALSLPGSKGPGDPAKPLHIWQEGLLYNSQSTLTAFFSLILLTIVKKILSLDCANLPLPTLGWTLWEMTACITPYMPTWFLHLNLFQHMVTGRAW